VFASLIAFAAVLLPSPAGAQQTQLDLHGNLTTGTSSHSKSWGGGAGVQFTVGDKAVKVSLSPRHRLSQAGEQWPQPDLALR